MLISVGHVLLQSAKVGISIDFTELQTEQNVFIFVADLKRDLLEQAPYPEDSKSPHDFDPYTLNHAAKVKIICLNVTVFLNAMLTSSFVGGNFQSELDH